MRPKFPDSFELFYAVFEGSAEEVATRLQLGDDPNARGLDGRTPLYYAIRSRWGIEKANVLFTAGARIDTFDLWGKHVLHALADTQQESRSWNEKLVWLLDRGVDPNVELRLSSYSFEKYSRHPVGSTPLHMASYNNNLKVVKLLLARGANPNSRDVYASTPLHTATKRRVLYKRLIRTLIDAGADVNAVDIAGNTPLHEVASHLGRYALTVARLLVSRGAWLDMRNIEGKLPVDVVRQSPFGEAALRQTLTEYLERRERL